MRYFSLLLLFLAPLSLAIGIGETEVQSKLGEKLRLEIQLHGTDGLNKSEILASIASNKEYQQLEVNKELFHSQFAFTLNQDDQGRYLLLVSSSQAISEPFVQFVLKISTPNETLLKKVTTLLDAD